MISVCIATYNGEKFIKEQIESILPQLDSSDEIIISDDKSIDSTINIINEFNDKRIKVIFNKLERGYTNNFENALKHVSGDIIFLSDQDDIWRPNKVERCLEELKFYDIVVSDASIINSENEIISESYFNLRSPRKTFLGNIVKFSFLGCCLAFRSNILKKALPFPVKSKLCTHDNWLFLVGSCFFKYKILDEKLIFYRRHDGNVSTGGLISTTTIWFKIKYRFFLCLYLINRFF
jgi:glycosyltransferase involved in cell wall biosynthesis